MATAAAGAVGLVEGTRGVMAAAKTRSLLGASPVLSKPHKRHPRMGLTSPTTTTFENNVNLSSRSPRSGSISRINSGSNSIRYNDGRLDTRLSRSLTVRADSSKASETDSPPSSSTSSDPTPPVASGGWGTTTPRRFHVRSDQWLNILSSSLSFPFRLGSGAFIKGYKVSLVPVGEFPTDGYASFEVSGRKIVETGNAGPKPEKPIELYEFEGCPFCRKVREVVSTLDLDVLFYPTPRDGPNFRPKVIQMGGKGQFPYMIDPNTGVAMYESDNIIKYLVEKYGDGKVPIALSLGPITTITASLAMIARLGKGSKYTPARLPENPLQVWAYEPSPFCKIVREKLVELELPHLYHSTPRGSEKRNELFRRAGHFQVPYLEDPNTGVKMFESADIIQYLEQTYAKST